MAYAPGFTNDIFISYSHFDNSFNDATKIILSENTNKSTIRTKE